MGSWKTSAQSLVMRAIGTRRIHHAIEARLASIDERVESRLDAVLARIEDRDRSVVEQVDALRRAVDAIGGQLSNQGGANTERGDAVTNTLADVLGQLSVLVKASYDQGAARALGEVRAEISGLRADLAHESELREASCASDAGSRV